MTEVPDDTPASAWVRSALEEMSRLDRALYVAVAESETPTLDVARGRPPTHHHGLEGAS